MTIVSDDYGYHAEKKQYAVSKIGHLVSPLKNLL
jgi:hypothetical protein